MCILTEREGEPLKYFRHKHKTSCQNYDISRKKLLPTDEKGIKETLEEIHNRTIDLIYNYLLSKKLLLFRIYVILIIVYVILLDQMILLKKNILLIGMVIIIELI
jgi:hypothetical protein